MSSGRKSWSEGRVEGRRDQAENDYRPDVQFAQARQLRDPFQFAAGSPAASSAARILTGTVDEKSVRTSLRRHRATLGMATDICP
jgi:hypothetical protein